MPDDRQRVLLAVLKARGPLHTTDLAHHSIGRNRYGVHGDRWKIAEDLEALHDEGEVKAVEATVNGQTVTVAYDIPGMDRSEWDVRYNRAIRAQEEFDRRASRRERDG